MVQFLSRLVAAALLATTTTARAEWIELPWPALGATLPIWKPDDHNPQKKYPAIIWYHANGEQPTAKFIHQATEGKDFVLVGLTYPSQGELENTAPEISAALGILSALKQSLVGSLSVDPNRIYIGGFSKGGWQTSLLLKRDRTLAGGLIIGAGVTDKDPNQPKFSTKKPIYVGAGRFDQNYPQALGALIYFRDLGAYLTLDPWPDLEHQLPETTPEALRQWLRIQATPHNLKTEAQSWLRTNYPKIAQITDPVERWLAYDHFLQLPFVKTFGPEAAAAAQTQLDTLLTNPAVAQEAKFRTASRKILALESRDRLLQTLTTASAGYAELAQQASGTQAGKDALRDLARTQDLLKNAKIVTLPEQPKPEPLTPEVPVGPTGPRGSDRGPFFPPGSKVKPAPR